MHVYYVIYCFQATIEHRKLAVNPAEVVIKCEVQRVKYDQETTEVRCVCKILIKFSSLKFNQHQEKFILLY